MSKNFKFSIVLFFDSLAKKSIGSIINQNLGFKDNIQLILCCDKKALKFALDYQEKYPNNIMVLSEDSHDNMDSVNDSLNRSICASMDILKNQKSKNHFCNLAINHCDGEYIGFLDSNDQYELNTLNNVYNFFNNHKSIDLVSVSILNSENEKERLKYEFEFDEKLFDLENYNNENNNYFYFPIYSTFIKKDVLTRHKFKSNIVDNDGLLVISEILLENPKFGFINNSYYYYSKKPNVLWSNICKEFVDEKFDGFFNYLIDYSIKSTSLKNGGELSSSGVGDGLSSSLSDDDISSNKIPEFIQFILIKELQKIASINDISSITNNERDVEDFWKSFYSVLNKIDISIIEDHNLINARNESFFVYLKNNDFHIEYKKNKVYLKSNNYVINKLHKHSIYLDIVEFKHGFLNLSGNFVSNAYYDSISVQAIRTKSNGDEEFFNGKFYEYSITERKLLKFLSIPWIYNYNFDFKIPISKNERSKVSLRVIFKEDENIILLENKISFRKYAGLSKFSHYLIKDSQIILFSNNAFNIMPFSYKKMVKYELRAFFEILRFRPEFYKRGIFYRILYLLLYPFKKDKKIWILMDRSDLADDNAEHLFKYGVNQKDDIDIYFAISKGSPDYKRLLKINKNILEVGSFKHKITYLFADKVITSQPAVSILNPFFTLNVRLFSGLVTAPVYFLQHGVTKDNISSWLHKFNRNLALILTTSDIESKSFLDVGYNYDSKIIQALGFTRFDNLNNDDVKKQIVIMPSWRNYIQNEKDLLESEYFKRWNNLINNNKLIDLAKNKGYEILFKPHPNLYKYIDLFDENDYVTIDYEKKYQEIFNESALLITDYSSIFFDFSYLKKPLIYYQYANDYHFDSENGYFNYKNMGFGDVITEEPDLIDKISNYLDNDCVMEDKYRERVENFFKYDDKNNCKRVYDWIYNH